MHPYVFVTVLFATMISVTTVLGEVIPDAPDLVGSADGATVEPQPLDGIAVVVPLAGTVTLSELTAEQLHAEPSGIRVEAPVPRLIDPSDAQEEDVALGD